MNELIQRFWDVFSTPKHALWFPTPANAGHQLQVMLGRTAVLVMGCAAHICSGIFLLNVVLVTIALFSVVNVVKGDFSATIVAELGASVIRNV